MAQSRVEERRGSPRIGLREVDDVSFLGAEHLKQTLGPHNSHFIRRPSEMAGSVQAGADVFQNRQPLDFKD